MLGRGFRPVPRVLLSFRMKTASWLHKRFREVLSPELELKARLNRPAPPGPASDSRQEAATEKNVKSKHFRNIRRINGGLCFVTPYMTSPVSVPEAHCSRIGSGGHFYWSGRPSGRL